MNTHTVPIYQLQLQRFRWKIRIMHWSFKVKFNSLIQLYMMSTLCFVEMETISYTCIDLHLHNQQRSWIPLILWGMSGTYPFVIFVINHLDSIFTWIWYICDISAPHFKMSMSALNRHSICLEMGYFGTSLHRDSIFIDCLWWKKLKQEENRLLKLIFQPQIHRRFHAIPQNPNQWIAISWALLCMVAISSHTVSDRRDISSDWRFWRQMFWLVGNRIFQSNKRNKEPLVVAKFLNRNIEIIKITMHL